MNKQETKEEIDVSEATKEIPVLSVDESLSVEQRFTDNAIDNILPARYLVKDENGDVKESPDELFERVADNVATAEFQFAEGQGKNSEAAQTIFEQWRDEFETLMKTQRFMPNSPTLMNGGARLQQLSACFVSSPKDDLEDIANTEKEWTLVQKTGGGMGADFSALRPKGTLISSTKGTTSGPVTFMQKYNMVAGVIKQGGVRRGAQMAELRVDHPDIGRFAVAKRKEGNLDNFNISASVTDDFIEAVENDEMYTLYSPQSDFEDAFEMVEATREFYAPSFQDFPKGEGPGMVYENIWRDFADDIEAWDWDESKTVPFRKKWEDRFSAAENNGRFDPGEPMKLPARFIWDIILDGAWRNGEPGLFHLDETNRQHSFDGEKHPDYQIYGTNPCFDGSTLLYTDSGMKSAEELYESGNPVSVVADSRMGGERVEEATNVFKTGNKDVYKLSTEEGYSINVTADHEIMTNNGWVEAQNLTQDDSIHILDGKGAFGGGGSKELGEVLGWFVGDGHAKNGEERAVLNFYEDDHELTERFENNVNSVIRDPIKDRDYSVSANEVNRSGNQVMESRIRSERLYEIIEEAELTEDKYQVPEQIFTGSEETVRGFLQALFSADGTVSNYGSTRNIRLSSTSKDMLQDVQRLLGSFGIACRIYEERKKAGTTTLPDSDGNDAEYERQALHEIHISKSNLETFQSEIGFLRSDKSEQLSAVLDSYSRGPEDEDFTATFESLEYLGERPVYDITQPNTNSLIAENINISNCAEQPLCEYEACNLGHINLSLMVEDGAPTHQEFINSIDYDYDTTSAEMYDYFEEAVDFEELDRVIEGGTRFLDNVVTMSEFPLEEIEEKVSEMRKIGLGVMGWAQMCYQMGIRYGSEESLQLGRIVMNYIDEIATKTSHELAKERGSFAVWDKSKYADPTEYPEWFKSHAYDLPEMHEDGYAMRNHNVTTVAPTGTTSMLSDTSGGIEPVYNVAYKKNVGGDVQGSDKLVEFDDVFIKTLKDNESDLDHTVEEIKEIALEQMNNSEFEGVKGLPVPQWMKDTFVTTNDLTAEEHGLMQRVFQEGVDSGISKCVAKGTVIKTDDGLDRIEALGDATDVSAETFADSTDTTIDGNDVTEHYNAGEKPATRVRFDNGQTLTGATSSHRVKTTDGWKKVGNLQSGDVIRGSYSESHGEGGEVIHWNPENNTNSNGIEPPAQLSPELSEWLGMVAADGSLVEETGKVGITHKNATVGQRFTELTRECFGTEPKTRIDKRNDVESVYLTSRDLYRWVTGLIGDGAYNKHVPDIILGGSKEEKRSFVEGLTLDGYVHENGLAVYEGMSEQLARDTASMLQSFGKPRVYVSRKYVSESDSMAYGVIVSNELHDEIVPVEPHKQVDTIDVRYKVYAPTESYSLDDYETGSDEYYAARSALNRGNDYLFNETAEKLGLESEEPVYKVTDVETVGSVQMYDIEVEDSHEYISNGVQSHNTVNLPSDSTHADVHDAYMLAVADDKLGATIKGLTIYRDQSREEQVLTTQEYSDLEVENAVEMLEDLGYSVEEPDDE